jgi:type II secretory pathway component PulM
VKLQDWYLGLVEREQRMVLWGGIAAGVLLLAGLVWQLGASVAQAEQRVERRRQDLAFIESVTPRLQTLPAARPGEPLTIAVDRMARRRPPTSWPRSSPLRMVRCARASRALLSIP